MWPLRIALARLRPWNAASVATAALVALLMGGFLLGDWALFRRLFRAAVTVEAQTPIFAIGIIRNFMELVLLVGFVVLFFSALTSSIGAFYLDLDLDLHHASPKSKSRIVLDRWTKTLLQSSYVVILFLIPLFIAYGQQFALTPAIVLRDIALLVVLYSIPVSAASLAVTLLVRYFPVRRVQQIAASLAILFISVAVVGVRVARPERLFSQVKSDDVTTVLKQIELPQADRYPSSWLAAVTTAGEGDEEEAASGIRRLLLTAAGAFALFFVVARPLYFRAWVRARESQAPTAIGGSVATSLFDRLTSRWSGPARAVFGKELRILVRDAAQWSQLMMMIALLFLYLYNIQMMPLEGDARAVLLAYLNVGMAGFVVAAMALRFAYPSLSAEGRAFWLIESAPISYRTLLWIKVLIFALPLEILTLILVVLANILLDAPREVWLFTVPGSFLVTATLVSLGVAMGALSPDFKRENPMEVALSLGGFAYMAVAFLYTGFMMLVLAQPTQRIFFRLVLGIDTRQNQVIGITPLLGGIALSFALILLPIEMAQRRLAARLR